MSLPLSLSVFAVIVGTRKKQVNSHRCSVLVVATIKGINVIGVKVRLKSKDVHNFTKSILEAFVTGV